MAWQDDVTTARDNSAAMLAEITATPRPSYSVHGRQFSWQQYQEYLTRQIEQCNKLLAQGQPWQLVTAGR